MLVVLKESVASNGTNQTVAINISSHDYIEIIEVKDAPMTQDYGE